MYLYKTEVKLVPGNRGLPLKYLKLVALALGVANEETRTLQGKYYWSQGKQ